MEERSQALYRRWRPQRFAEVVGQELVARALRNAVAIGRVSHAYLLCGPRGTGKTSLGRLIAKAVNCPSPQDGEPCNACPSCREYLAGSAPDLVEIDAASNRGIDEIRRLRDRVALAPMGGRYKVYLIDEVHMLTQEAHNALLKTLEEPPPHVIFVLATTEPHRLPSTVVSRCQRYDLRRIPVEAAVERLALICEQERFALSVESLRDIARAAAGSLRDAINLLEQVVAYYGPSPTVDQVREALGLSLSGRGKELARAIAQRDLAGALKAIAAARDDGLEMRRLGGEVVETLRQILLVQAGAADLAGLTPEEKQEIEALAALMSPELVMAAMKAFASAQLQGRDDPFSPLPLELAVAQVLGPPSPPKASSQGPSPQEEKVSGAPTSVEAPALTLAEELVRACQQFNLALAGHLRHVTVKALEGETLVLSCPFPNLAQILERPDHRELLERAAARILGHHVSIRCEVEALSSAPTPKGYLVEEALRHGAIPLSTKNRGGEGDVTEGT